MNQILVEKKENNNLNSKKVKSKNKLRTFFKFQFIISSIVVFSTSIYYAYSSYENNRKEQLSKKILNKFNITTLYSNTNTDYVTNRASTQTMYIAEDTNFSVIGLIEIKSIKINYPIISNYNADLLKIAPCRFMGPMPNEVGNLCIAGHNYNSYKFFSKLKDLPIGDTISIFDLSRKKNRLLCIQKL